MDYMEFCADTIEVALNLVHEVDEVYVETRKNVPQTRYIIEFREGDSWYDGSSDVEVFVPDNWVGFWMMTYPDNLQYTTLMEALSTYEWVKCEERTCTVSEWVGV